MSQPITFRPPAPPPAWCRPRQPAAKSVPDAKLVGVYDEDLIEDGFVYLSGITYDDWVSDTDSSGKVDDTDEVTKEYFIPVDPALLVREPKKVDKLMEQFDQLEKLLARLSGKPQPIDSAVDILLEALEEDTENRRPTLRPRTISGVIAKGEAEDPSYNDPAGAALHDQLVRGCKSA